MKKKTKQKQHRPTTNIIFKGLYIVGKALWTFICSPVFYTAEVLFTLLSWIETVGEWLADAIRGVLRWLQNEYKNYIKRILWALIGKEYLHPSALWNPGWYLTKKLTQILPRFIEGKTWHPIHFKDQDEYTTKLKELLLLCQQEMNDNHDITTPSLHRLFQTESTILDNKAYFKELERRYKRRCELFWELVPGMWD